MMGLTGMGIILGVFAGGIVGLAIIVGVMAFWFKMDDKYHFAPGNEYLFSALTLIGIALLIAVGFIVSVSTSG